MYSKILLMFFNKNVNNDRSKNMPPKKIFQLILINLLIIIANVSVFSKAFLGFSLLFGSALSMSLACFTLLGSIASFAYFNRNILLCLCMFYRGYLCIIFNSFMIYFFMFFVFCFFLFF